MLAKMKAKQVQGFTTVSNQIGANRDLYGPACTSALKAAVKKAQDGCLQKANRESVDYLKVAGKAQCGG